MIINIETKIVQTATNDPGYNWAGDGWAYVPQHLEADAWAYAPYCVIELDDDGVVTSITDDGTRPPPVEPEPPEPPEPHGDIAQIAADVAEALAAIDAFLEEIAPESSQIIAIEKDTMGASLEGVRING